MAAALEVPGPKTFWPGGHLFYFRRDRMTLFDETSRPELVQFLRRTPTTLVLVEQGPPLEDFLDGLPVDLNAVVYRPGRWHRPRRPARGV